MRRAARSGDFGAWFAAHADYHRLITGGAGEAMKRQLQALCRPHDPLYPHLPAL